MFCLHKQGASYRHCTLMYIQQDVKANTFADPGCLRSVPDCYISPRKMFLHTKQQIYFEQKAFEMCSWQNSVCTGSRND